MTPPEETGANDAAIRELAARAGLRLAGPLSVNEVGLDYRVVIGAVEDGTRWVLRIPRREDVRAKVGAEARTLAFLRRHVPFAVPEWRVATPELVAYPLLVDTTAMVVHPGPPPSSEWKIDPESAVFSDTLAAALAALHAIPIAEAAAAGMPVRTSEQARRQVAEDVARVHAELGIGEALHRRWQSWLDDDASWPDFTTPIHGDLYAGHVLVDAAGRVSGMIDWSEARVDDPAIDMSGHLLAFGEQGLERLLRGYEAAGGRTWPRLAHHVAERAAAFPVAFALFAIQTRDEQHLAAARAQLAAG